jgi:hypothetical protein
MTNNNMWDCADMPPMFSAKWNIDDSSVLIRRAWYLHICDIILFSESKYYNIINRKL